MSAPQPNALYPSAPQYYSAPGQNAGWNSPAMNQPPMNPASSPYPSASPAPYNYQHQQSGGLRIQHRSLALPYVSDLSTTGGIFPGKSILIQGVVSSSAKHGGSKRMVVELCCGPLIQANHHENDKALHLNPRFDTSGQGLFGLGKPDTDIVVNSLISHQWGGEQRCANPLEMDKPFSLRILVHPDHFQVEVNGRYLCDFRHRIPWQAVKFLHVDGCCRLDVVEYQ